MHRRKASEGQVLVMFTLFLLVLLAIAALAIDYAGWLLTDRALQNAADHASLAGASVFDQRQTQGSCLGTGGPKCTSARAQAWTSLNDELKLGMSTTIINCLASNGNSPSIGEATSARASTGACTSEPAVTFNHSLWVSTPPPNDGSYENFGGKYALNYGIVWVRVDRAVRSFLGGAIGIKPADRTGWATAGSLPTDYALEIFCRNGVAPQQGNGVCDNSAGLTIDGQGGVHLVRGDIGSNESLTVTSNVGNGVIVESGNVFLVNRSCASSTWNCPNSPPRGGISDGVNGKNAFYIAPLPVPQYESPLDYAALSVCPNAATWNANRVPCIPYRNEYGTDPAPNTGSWTGDWRCGDGTTACGTPILNGDGTFNRCDAGSYNASSRFLRPNVDDQITSRVHGSQYNTANPTSNYYRNMNESVVDPGGVTPGTTPTVLAGPAGNWVYTEDNRALTYRVGLTPPQGIPSGTDLTVRYVLVRTANGAVDTAAGANVPVKVRLVQKTGNNSYPIVGAEQSQNATQAITFYQYTASMSGIVDYSKLFLEFEVAAVSGKGMGIPWAEVEIPGLLPPTPPTIKPGYWHSIVIPPNGCALLDPSPSVGLAQYQLPGVFRFGGSGTGAGAPRVVIGSGGYLVGDAVTLVFDPRAGASGFPDNGIDIGTNGALVINSGTTTYNPSYPLLTDVPYNALNAAWQVDSEDTTNPRNGENMWPVCTAGGNGCVPSKCYMNTNTNLAGCVGLTTTQFSLGRGIAFYLTPISWTPGSGDKQQRFYMSGNGTADAPGIAFKGVLYAPYDDVRMSGRNGFNTVGQVLAWNAKFNGGSASIYLDYPYAFVPARPYLLEPTIAH